MMPRMKPLREQTIVITGASSGVGRITARLAAERGAQVVLAARNEADLEAFALSIRQAGGKAVHCPADVSDEAQVERLATCALEAFGGIDTWVNNAGVSSYGRLMDVEVEDMRRQFDVNFWGTVHGSRIAVRYLSREGGTLINIASAVADRAIPLQGAYAASKHAVKAFTDALRMELEEEGVPVYVSLIKPGSLDTPLFQKARTVLGSEPQPIPPVYAPELAAEAILECAVNPVRDVIVGGMGKALTLAEKTSPRLTDRYMEKSSFISQQSAVPVGDDREDNLYFPVEWDGGEHGSTWKGRTRGTSLYTWAALHPGRAAAVLAATVLGVGIATLVTSRESGRLPRRMRNVLKKNRGR